MNIGIVEVFNTNGTRVGGFKPLPKFANVFPYLEKGDSPYMMFRDTTLNTVLKTKLKWHLIDPPRDTVLDLIDLGNGYYDAQVAGDSVERWVSVNLLFTFVDSLGEPWEIYKVNSSSNTNLIGSTEHHIGNSIEFVDLQELQRRSTQCDVRTLLTEYIKSIS